MGKYLLEYNNAYHRNLSAHTHTHWMTSVLCGPALSPSSAACHPHPLWAMCQKVMFVSIADLDSSGSCTHSTQTLQMQTLHRQYAIPKAFREVNLTCNHNWFNNRLPENQLKKNCFWRYTMINNNKSQHEEIHNWTQLKCQRTLAYSALET